MKATFPLLRKPSVLSPTTAAFLMGVFVVTASGAAAAAKGGRVEIIRDSYGVPHVFGATLADAVFGQGYCHAEDNLALVLDNIASARGQSALRQGRARAENDLLVLAFKLMEVSRHCHEALPPESRAIVDAYADGVNRYLADHPAERPEWLVTVTGLDVVATTKLRHLQQAIGVAQGDLAGASQASRESDLSAGADPGGASNMWALRPSRTTDGSVRLLSDPHLPWDGATKWHEAHLIVGDRWIYGAMFAGAPGIGIGFTPDVAWGFTNNGADLADVYRLALDPANPDRYRYDGGWRDIKTETFVVEARDPAGNVKKVERKVRYSHHGPILRENKARHEAFAVRIANFDEQAETLGWVGTFNAKNLKEFEAALDVAHGYKWNCIAADRQGDIGYYYICAARERNDRYRWNAPVDGSTSATEWGRALTWRDLPHLVNPPSGYLVNCNNNPYTVTRDCPLKPAGFPRNLASQGTELRPNTRAYRATELIEARPRHDDASWRAITFDLQTLTAQPIVSLILDADKSAGSKIADPAGRRPAAVKTLRAWDGRATVENRALPVLSGFLQAAAKNDIDAREVGQMKPADVIATLDAGLALLEKRWGKGPVTWGQLHVIKRGNTELPMPGAGSERGADPFSTLFMIGAKKIVDGKFPADSGSSWVQSVVYRDGKVAAETIVPFGNSNRPASPHYGDQMPLFAALKMKPARLTRPEIEAGAVSRLILIRN